MATNAFDELVDAGQGGAALNAVLNPPYPGEFPSETRQRIAHENVIRARDFSDRGIPSFTNDRGSVTAVTDETGKALTGLDSNNNIAYDSAGNPRTIKYGEKGGPELGDPFAGLPEKIDPKTGNKYQVAKGLPWKWTGVDQSTADAAAMQTADKVNQKETALLRGKQTLDEHDFKRYTKVRDDLKGDLRSTVPILNDPKYEGADLPSVQGAIDEHFNQLYGAPEANQKTEESLALRAGIDQQKAKAYRDAETVFGLNEHIDRLGQQIEGTNQTLHDNLDTQYAHLHGQPGPNDVQSRGEEDQGTHMPEVAGSTPAPATNQDGSVSGVIDQQMLAEQHPAVQQAATVPPPDKDGNHQPEGFWGTAGRAFASKIFPALGTAGGGIGGAALGGLAGIETGPGAIATAVAGDIAGGAAGGAATEALQKKVMGENWYRANLSQMEANAKAHPLAESLGTMFPFLISLFGGGGAKVYRAASEILPGITAKGTEILVGKAMTSAGREAVLEAARTGSKYVAPKIERIATHAAMGARAGAAAGAEQAVQTGDLSAIPDEAARGAITFGATGLFPVAKTLLGQVLGRAATDSAAMALAGQIYDSAVHGQKFDMQKVADETAGGFVPFALQNALFAAISHGMSMPRRGGGEGGEAGPDAGGPPPDGQPPKLTFSEKLNLIDIRLTQIKNSEVPAAFDAEKASLEQQREALNKEATTRKPSRETPPTEPVAPGEIGGKGRETPPKGWKTSVKGGKTPENTELSAAEQNFVERGGHPDKLEGQQKLEALRKQFPEAKDRIAAIERHLAGTTVDEAANGAATSPKNNLPEPTQAQKDAGNYQKGPLKLAGLDISIENPAGSKRREEWSPLKSHYGYIKGTEGNDTNPATGKKDNVDVFVKEGTPLDWSGPIFVVNQHHTTTARIEHGDSSYHTAAKGDLDEHKAVIGVSSEKEAFEEYKSNYERGWKGGKSVVKFDTPEDFQTWLKEGDMSQPAEGSKGLVKLANQKTSRSMQSDAMYSVNKKYLETGKRGEKPLTAVDREKLKSEQAALVEQLKREGWPHLHQQNIGHLALENRQGEKGAGNRAHTLSRIRAIEADMREHGVEFTPHEEANKGGEKNAPTTGKKPEGDKSKHPGVPPGPDVPADKGEQGKKDSGQTGGGGGAGKQPETPAKGNVQRPVLDLKAKLEAENLVRGNMKQHAERLKALGHGVEPVIGETEGEAGLEIEWDHPDGARILLDPAKLAEATKGLDTRARNKYIARSVEEEILHLATERWIAEDPSRRQDLIRFGGEKDELYAHMAKTYQGWEELNNHQRGHEKLRAIMQQRWKGHLTEGAYRLVREVVKYLRGIWDKLTPHQRQMVEGVERQLKGEKKASPPLKEIGSGDWISYTEGGEQKMGQVELVMQRHTLDMRHGTKRPTETFYLLKGGGSVEQSQKPQITGNPAEHPARQPRKPDIRKPETKIPEKKPQLGEKPTSKLSPEAQKQLRETLGGLFTSAPMKDKAIAERLKRGASIEQLAKEHRMSPTQVEQAYDRAIAPQDLPEQAKWLSRQARQFGMTLSEFAQHKPKQFAQLAVAWRMRHPISTAAPIRSGQNAEQPEEDYEKPVPPDKIPQFVAMAQTLIDQGVETPADLARELHAISPKARGFSQHLWNAIRMFKPDKERMPNWTEEYARLTNESESPTLGEGETQSPNPDDANGPSGAPLGGSDAGTDAGTKGGGKVSIDDAGSSGDDTRSGAKTSRTGLDKGRSERTGVEPMVDPISGNLRLYRESGIGEGGLTRKFRDNVTAIRALRLIESEQREPTDDERKALSRYVGWGGLAQKSFDEAGEYHAETKELLTPEEFAAARASTTNAHFTSPDTIEGIWDAARHLGFSGGRVMENSIGVGHFYGFMPQDLMDDSDLIGVERDNLTARIAKVLYPGARIFNRPFEKHVVADDSIDLNIGNYPFSNRDHPHDPRYNSINPNLHDYFFLKSLDKVRPGGFVMAITSIGTMDKLSPDVRQWLSAKANLVGAFRLPDNAFKGNASTEVTTDLIILQKRGPGVTPIHTDWLNVVEFETRTKDKIRINQYFRDNPDHMMGTMTSEGTMYGSNQKTLKSDGRSMAEIFEAIKEKLPEGIFVSSRDSRRIREQGVDAELDPNTVKDQSYILDGGELRQMDGGRLIEPMRDVSDSTLTHKVLKKYVESGLATIDEESQVIPSGATLPKVEKPSEKRTHELLLAGKLRGHKWNEVRDEGYLDADGNPQVREVLVPKYEFQIPLSDLETKRAKQLIPLRDTLRQILYAQLQDAPDEEIKRLQRDLNTLYDTYVRQHGHLWESRTAQAFGGDTVFYPLLLALEDYDAVEERTTKSDIFSRRTRVKREPLTSLTGGSDKDNLVRVLSERGKVDLELMSELTNTTPEELERRLTEQDLIYVDPSLGTAVETEEYLSGNVYQKLDAAVLAAKEEPERFERNVEALRKVIPEPKSIEKIHAGLGSAWIPLRLYEQFLQHLTGAGASVKYKDGRWTVATAQSGPEGTFTDDYGTAALFGMSMNLRDARVMRYPKEGSPYEDVEATVVARAAQDTMKNEFKNWILDNPDVAEEVAGLYNRNFRALKDRSFTAPFERLPEMNDQINLRQHQLDAVWRGTVDGKMIMAHVVGAGKTFAFIGIGMEWKRLGLAQKPMYVVPNHLLRSGQIAADFYRMYPHAKLLTVTRKDFEAKRRRRLMAKIATGTWDAVLIGHSQIGMIPVSAELQATYIARELEAMEETLRQLQSEDDGSKMTRKTIKKLEGDLAAKRSQMEKLLDPSRADQAITFEELGVDALIVDEAHEFKNLNFWTKLQNIGGLGSANTETKKTALLKIKTDYVLRQNNGRNLIFATGTPITNTIAEIYLMEKYMAQELLDQAGIKTFDEWAAIFANIAAVGEISPDGQSMQVKNKIVEFRNATDMIRMFRRFTDVQRQEQLKLPIPDLVGGKIQNIVFEAPPVIKDLMADVLERAEALRGGSVDPREDNWLKLTSDGKKISIDPRLFDYTLPDDPGYKSAKAVDNIFRVWQANDYRKGTQIVFCDNYANSQEEVMTDTWGNPLKHIRGPKRGQIKVQTIQRFNLFDYMRDRLVRLGAPENQIAIIHDYEKDEQKAELFNQMNKGEKRILFGTTAKLGTGTNIQRRAVAVWSVDGTWRPDQMTQREGRVIRQGNEFHEAGMADHPDLQPVPHPRMAGAASDVKAEGTRTGAFQVLAARLATEGTLDSRIYQTITTKTKLVEDLMNGDLNQDTIQDVGEAVLTGQEMIAAASGNPLYMEMFNLEADIRKLEIIEADVQRKQERAVRELKWFKTQLEASEEEKDFVQPMHDAYQTAAAAVAKRKAEIKEKASETARAKAGEVNPEKPFRFGDADLTLAEALALPDEKEKGGRGIRNVFVGKMQGRIFRPKDGIGRDQIIFNFAGYSTRHVSLTGDQAEAVESLGILRDYIFKQEGENAVDLTRPFDFEMRDEKADTFSAAEDALTKALEESDSVKAKVFGVEFIVEKQTKEGKPYIATKNYIGRNNAGYQWAHDDSIASALRTMDLKAYRVKTRGEVEENIQQAKLQIARSEEASKMTFTDADKLAAKRTRLAEILAILNPEENADKPPVDTIPKPREGELFVIDPKERPLYERLSALLDEKEAELERISDFGYIPATAEEADYLDGRISRLEALIPILQKRLDKIATVRLEQAGDTSIPYGFTRSSDGRLHVAAPIKAIQDRLTPGLEILTDIKQGIQSLLLPTAKSPEHLRAAEMVGAKLGPMHRRQEAASEYLKPDRLSFEKMGVRREDVALVKNPGIQFMSDISQGKIVDPKLRATANKIERLFEGRVDLLEAADAPLQTVRENYFPGMWTRESRLAFNLAVSEALDAGIINDSFEPNTATMSQQRWIADRVEDHLRNGKGSEKDGLQFLTRRPLKGSETFRKQKVFDDILTAVKFGLRPISNNPIDLVMLKLGEMDRSIMANQIFQEAKDRGQMKVITPFQKVPDGWEKVNDRHGTVYGPITTESEEYRGLPIYGYRIVPTPLADILNNYLSSSLYNNRYFGTLYKGWMGIANALNQTQLGVGSAFHAGFTTAEAQISAGANLIKDVYGLLLGNRSFNDVVKTGKDYSTASVETALTGDKVLNAWRKPDSPMDPRIAQVVRAAELAGAGFRLETGLKTGQTEKFVQDWLNGHRLRAARRTPIAFVEMLAKPIMEMLVPRQKAGVFAHLAWRIIEQNPGASLDSLRGEFRAAWNRVDARLGQVRYDRLFIHNVAKNVAQGTIRAPGWSGGTIAELGGAFKDMGGFFKEFAKTGKLPADIPDRAAYAMSLVVTIAVLNAVLTYLFTGKQPEGMDYWAFQTGEKDDHGNAQRWMLPTYAKDIIAYSKQPLTTLIHKAHPLLSVVGDLIKNRDYYGVEIRDSDANAFKQAAQAGGYVAKAFEPFWIRGARKEVSQAGMTPKALLPLIGIMPAPRTLTQTAAQAEAAKINQANLPAAPLTQRQAERRQEKSELSSQIRRGKTPDFSGAIRSGSIKGADIPSLYKRASMPSIALQVDHMKLEDAEQVYAKATAEEKKQLASILARKRANSAKRNHAMFTGF